MFLLGFNHFFQFRFFYYLVVFCSLLLVQCQPTNTTVGKSISKGGVTSGTGANSNVTSQLQQLRLTDANHQLLTGQQLSVAVGDTLNLHADIYTLGGEKVSEAQVRWNLRAVSGQTTTGLSCSGTVTNTCDFTPTAPGSVYVEINSVERNSQVVAPTDTSPLVVVTAPSVPTALELTSGNLQTGIVNSLVAQPLNVTVKDAFGRGIQGVEVNFNVTAGTGTITTSNPHITDAQGTASAQFRLGTSTLTPQSHQVVATVASAPSLTQTFTASALPASLASLQFSTPPLATYALLPFYQQPVVVAHDTYGNTMTTLLDPLTVMVKTGGGTLTGSTTKNFTNGVVTFNDLAYSTTDSNVELRFTVGTIHLDSAPLNFIAATGQPNITPDDVHFGFKVSSVAGPAGRKTSDPVTIGGLSQNISVSVSGPGNPKLLKNSDVVEMPALFNVANTDTIRVVADSPSTTHGVHVITVNMGGRTETFEVRYADPNVVVYGFVTSSMQNGAGVNDSICAVDAAARGYLGSWKGIFATTSQSIKERIPSQWGQMKRLDGQVVASSWEQLWTGVLTNPLNTVIDGSTGSLNVWTGASDASTQTNLANSCQNWTSVTVTDNARLGLSSETSTNWYSNTSLSCGGFPRMYCISVPTGVQDTNPNDVSFSEQVATSGTQRLTSNSVTVSGVTTPILVSITATGGNPRIKINSGAEVTSGTVGNGDQITLVMDAPSVLNQKNTATLTLGDDSVTWWVGLADTSRTAAIFVSSVDYNGDLGGLAGAHSKCQSLADAQGFGGTWKAVLNTTSAGPAQNIVSWSWGTLKRLDGAVVATSWNDLWDGTIGVPISLTETLVTKNSFVTTGNILDTGIYCVNFAR